MKFLLFRLLAAGLPIDTSPLPRGGLDSSGNPSNELFINAVNIIIGILAAIAFISIVYGGFKYVISRGEPDKIGKAKDIILYSLIGLVISMSAFGIVNLVIKVLF